MTASSLGEAVQSALMDISDARRFVLDAVRPLAPRCARLDETLGRVTSRAIHAPSELPPFANSAMDGYAIHSGDTVTGPARLRVVGAVLAGGASVRVRRGEAARIMTGAPIPTGVDAVVPHELTEADGEVVVVPGQIDPGAYIRPAGSDIAAGQEIFPPGTAITPRHIGVLAGLGVDHVEVVPRPRVGVLSTGDELVGDGALTPASVRDANRPALCALVREANLEPVDLGVVGDDEGAITCALEDGAARCDAVLTSGGVSVGDVDLVKVVLDTMSGGTMRWMQVAIRPAKPFAFGLIETSGVPVFALAGNPVSAIVGFEMFARPALRKMGGHRQVDRPVACARAIEDLRRERDGKMHLFRVVLERAENGDLGARPSGGQGSHMSLSLAYAHGLALVPDGEGIESGQPVDVVVFDDCLTESGVTSLDDTLRRLRSR